MGQVRTENPRVRLHAMETKGWSQMKFYMGIDPGKSGGIAEVPQHGVEPIIRDAMPDTLKDIWHVIESGAGDTITTFCLIEKVHSMPGQGVASTFAFGRNFGQLEMALTAAEIPFDYVTPTKWQKEFGLSGRKDESKTEKKNRHKALAQQLFPKIQITHAIADALLIAEYCRRVHG